MSPLELVREVTRTLDALEIPYALGGSLASSLVGEPRSTADADLAVRLPTERVHALLDQASARFYVPKDAALDAIRAVGLDALLAAALEQASASRGGRPAFVTTTAPG